MKSFDEDVRVQQETLDEMGLVEDSVKYLMAGSVLGFSIMVVADFFAI